MNASIFTLFMEGLNCMLLLK